MSLVHERRIGRTSPSDNYGYAAIRGISWHLRHIKMGLISGLAITPSVFAAGYIASRLRLNFDIHVVEKWALIAVIASA